MNGVAAFDPELVRPLLAGWISGAMLGLADTALLVIAISRSPGWPHQLSGLRVSLPVFSIVAINAMLIGWTLVGLLAGVLWITLPGAKFAALVGLVTVGGMCLYAFVRGLKHRGEAVVVVGTGLMAMLAFLGVLPVLASWRS